MSDIAKRLKAALKYDVLNGDSTERAILGKQIQEAISWIERQTTEYGEFERHRCPRCDLVLWAENMQYGDGSPATCPECSNVRWAMVAEQCHDLNYGEFHLVRFTYEEHAPQWIVYRKGFAAFHDEDLEPKYFPGAAQALDAIDELMREEREATP